MKTRYLILIILALSTLAQFGIAPAQAGTIYVGNSLTVPNGGSDASPPLVILDEYSASTPLASTEPFVPGGTVQDIRFYGQAYNFTFYVLVLATNGPGANERTFQVVASHTYSGSPASPGIQVLPVSGISLTAGEFLAFDGTGPYYSQNADDALNSDATYENSASPGSFVATAPGGPGTKFIVGIHPDVNATYEYVPDSFGNQGRNYGIGVDVSLTLPAGTTIDRANRYAYGANIGWINGVADTNNGAVIGDYVCAGYLYSANVGWINLGSGEPANGIQYQNNSASDFGVNQDGLGDLTGYAYGANIGWITFEQTYGRPKVNLRSGILSGYAWSANCGWISLSNAVTYVQTDSLFPGELAANGLPAPWLLQNFGTVNVSTNADPTGKGMTIAQDYIAGTDPNNVNSVLRITTESFNSYGQINSLTWLSQPTRLYYIMGNTNLQTPTWQNSNLGLISPAAGSTTPASFTDTKAAAKFYHVQAVVPLSP